MNFQISNVNEINESQIQQDNNIYNQEEEESKNDYGIQNIPRKFKQSGNLIYVVSGVIESAEAFKYKDLCLKYSIVVDNQQVLINGYQEGSTQQAVLEEDQENNFVFNIPFESTFEIENVTNWPQLLIVAKSPNFLRNDLLDVGFGFTYMPISDGVSYKNIPLYNQKSTSVFSFLFQQPNIDQKNLNGLICKGENRSLLKVENVGNVRVKFQVYKENFGVNRFC